MSDRPKTPRRRLFELHSWVGFQLAVFMALVVATGTFAVVSDEIDWLLHPELRASAGETKLGWHDIENAVRAHVPGHVILRMTEHEGDYFNAKVSLIDPQGRFYFLYVDPYTGKVAGETGTLTVQRFLRDLHRYLFMPSVIGLPLVTTMAVVLLISLYTGLKTARNWGRIATRVRFHRGARVALGDLHKSAGIWSIWFFVVIILTSFWYFAELASGIAGERFEPSRPGITAERVASFGQTVELADTATLVASAEAAFPGLRVTDIEFAVAANLAASVLGRYEDPLVRSRANRVYMDPVSAETIHVQKSQHLGVVAYLNELADPLHFGYFGGLVTKAIWFIFGLAMLGLTVTGVWLSWKRLKLTAPTTAHWATVPLLVIVAAFAVPYVQRHVFDGRFEHSQSLDQVVNDELLAALTLQTDAAGQATGPFTLNVRSATGRVNLAEVELRALVDQWQSLADDSAIIKPRLLGETVVVEGRLAATDLANATAVELTLTFLSGDSIVTQFAL